MIGAGVVLAALWVWSRLSPRPAGPTGPAFDPEAAAALRAKIQAEREARAAGDQERAERARREVDAWLDKQ